MKKYADPKMSVNVFEAESVVTASGQETTSYSDWKKAKGAQGVSLAYDSFNEIAAADMSE